MIYFPPCKINLGLHILAKRSDGFHDIETGFYQVAWCDLLEIIPSGTFSFRTSGIPVEGQEEDNICIKAWKLISKDFTIPPVSIHLHKVIPTGAGLGGGSSDGAYVLTGLNEIFSLGLSRQQLAAYATTLGSDCAFFLEKRPCVGTGRGEILEEVALDLKGKHLMIVCPDIHVSTAKAYSMITAAFPVRPLKEVLALPMETWNEYLWNDFEAPVIAAYPEIGAIKNKMRDLGADYSSMSGSGAAVFGIFSGPRNISKDFPEMAGWTGELK